MITGDIKIVNGQFYVFDGEGWKSVSTHEVDEVDRFEKENKSVHDEHPDLKRAWDEYVILRKLKGI